MAFYSLQGVPDKTLDEKHHTSTGESYTLRYNEDLRVEMQFLGKEHASTNAQGWERNSSKYFEQLYANHPEMFSKANIARLKNGQAPIVDQKMISYNPQWAEYKNQVLIHHHIGGDGEVVAVPQNAHKGQGEVHNSEKAAGITDRCKKFSESCENRPDAYGQTASNLHKTTNNRAQAVREESAARSEDVGASRAMAIEEATSKYSAENTTRPRSDLDKMIEHGLASEKDSGSEHKICSNSGQGHGQTK